MSDWLKWTAPVAAVMSIAAPAHAIQYMSVEEAQKTAFPGASFAEVQAGRVWKASSGGYFYYDHVVGKSNSNEVRVNSDIRNISGATLSSTHLAEGVKKVLSYHASHFR